MSFERLLGAYGTWTRLTGNRDDDAVDRLNHIYTVVLLLVFALFVAGGAYIQDPIVCVLPELASSPQLIKYVNNHCWIGNTYYVPFDTEIPVSTEDRIDLEVKYYQYVPLILIFMALLFKTPNMLWRMFHSFCGLDLEMMVRLTMDAHYVEERKREEKIRDIAATVDRWLESNRQYRWNFLVRLRQKAARFCFFLNRREGTYLTGLYLVVKILYVVNVVGQFFILDAFLGGFFSMWGVEAANSLVYEYRTKESRRFPRITLCDYTLRQLQNVPTFTAQCVLSINLYNEKIFLFLWFWFVLVSIVTGANFLLWVWRNVYSSNRAQVVKKFLKLKSRIQTERDKKMFRKFLQYLRHDGIFLLRMIEKNSNYILVSDLVARLWDNYTEKPMVKKMFEVENANGRIANGNAASVHVISSSNYV